MSDGYNLSFKRDIIHLEPIMSRSPPPSPRYGCCGRCLTTSLLWSCLQDKPGSILLVYFFLERGRDSDFIVKLSYYFGLMLQLTLLLNCYFLTSAAPPGTGNVKTGLENFNNLIYSL